jgi:hypothetical protein
MTRSDRERGKRQEYASCATITCVFSVKLVGNNGGKVDFKPVRDG